MKHAHLATIKWTNPVDGPEFLKGRYSREHSWSFDGGFSIQASPAPSVVPAPWSTPGVIDPEEAFVASLSSCHMLTFLWFAARAGFVVETYEDAAAGEMAKNEKGVPWVAVVTLNPKITWSAEKQPTAEELDKLHHQAHEQCFIANSVKTEIKIVS